MNFEQLGAFYLGRTAERHGLDSKAEGVDPEGEPLLYDAKDLTTHAMVVGMTGSGKTGLSIGLLEEAALDGVPAICIDPKGDLGNLALTFPELRPEDFRPWIDEGAAARVGETPDEHAASVAARWERGIESFGQSRERIQRLKDAAEVRIYTPGSSAGIQLSALRGLSAPDPQLAEDLDAVRERVVSTVAGLLALVAVDADPLTSREHVLLANILDRAWRDGRSLSLVDLVRKIIDPGIDQLGVIDLETFFPKADRQKLALRFNGLLASPGFSAWTEGEPLDVDALLRAPDGRPRISVLSIAHLPDQERMFFVTLLLNEVVAWMRGQAGTSSLRAILYMDEVFGFFPPVKNPPSKTPMLTLLKQARAFGLGVVLASQNPVDLDYKALSNCGTWFLGRLQTERDVDRVVDGLRGAAAAERFDEQAIRATLAGLKSREFFLQNAHDNRPALFETRWVLNYLRGPLTSRQLRTLTEPYRSTEGRSSAPKAKRSSIKHGGARPALDPEVPELFLSADRSKDVIYQPECLADVRLHYTHRHAEIDFWAEPAVHTRIKGQAFDELQLLHRGRLPLEPEPIEDARYAPLPGSFGTIAKMKKLQKKLIANLYRDQKLIIGYCREHKLWSRVGESRAQFAARVEQVGREERDRRLEKLRRSYAPKLQRIEQRIERAKRKVEKEEQQYSQQKYQTAVSVGATVLSAILGRRGLGSATSAARGAGRAANERGDIAQAKESLADLQAELEELTAEFEAEATALRELSLAAPIEEKEVRPKKSDIEVVQLAVLWAPYAQTDRRAAWHLRG
ncbi:MAG: DUF87 domain-containing protein [Myxococcota bacterium]